MNETVLLPAASDTWHFGAGLRVTLGPRPRWYVRAWRWLTKRNHRVAVVDHEAGTVTLERCR